MSGVLAMVTRPSMGLLAGSPSLGIAAGLQWPVLGEEDDEEVADAHQGGEVEAALDDGEKPTVADDGATGGGDGDDLGEGLGEALWFALKKVQ
jgi:hypothetical protein